MTRKRVIVAVSTVLLVATALALGLARTGAASGTPQEKGVYRAYVLGDGTLQSHSKDVLASANLGTGSYQITMKKALANCAVTATIAADGNGFGETQTWFASAVSPQTIGVGTTDGAGNAMNCGFFPIVACTP